MLGSLASAFFSKYSPVIKSKDSIIEQLGNLMATLVDYENKLLVLISVCRVPLSLSQGVCCSITQCDKVDGQVKSPSQCWKEIFQET